MAVKRLEDVFGWRVAWVDPETHVNLLMSDPKPIPVDDFIAPNWGNWSTPVAVTRWPEKAPDNEQARLAASEARWLNRLRAKHL